MTKREFETIASILNDCLDNTTTAAEAKVVRDVISTFATELGRHNPRFNRDRFVHAASMGVGPDDRQAFGPVNVQ